jgi:hypothetical protein
VLVKEASGDEEAVYESKPIIKEIEVEEGQGRLLSGPAHVGGRRHAQVSKDEPLDEVKK